MYEARQTAGVLPSSSATSRTTCGHHAAARALGRAAAARRRQARARRAPSRARCGSPSGVASGPSSSLTYAPTSALVTSCQVPPSRHASSSSPSSRAPLERADRGGDVVVLDDRVPDLAGLGGEVQVDARSSACRRVTCDREQRGQAVRPVLQRVALAADAQVGEVEQPEREREHLLARHPVEPQVPADATTGGRQPARRSRARGRASGGRDGAATAGGTGTGAARRRRARRPGCARSARG